MNNHSLLLFIFLLSSPFLFNYILPPSYLIIYCHINQKSIWKNRLSFLLKKTTQFINEERCQNTTAVFPSVIPHKLCSCLIFQSQIPNQFHWPSSLHLALPHTHKWNKANLKLGFESHTESKYDTTPSL